MSLAAFIPSGQSLVTVNGLHQWDYGRSLVIQMPSIGTCEAEVHFACQGVQTAERRACAFVNGVGSVVIPDLCLEQTAPVVAWVYTLDNDFGKTVATITLPIIERARPAEATPVPTSVHDRYTEVITEMNRIIDSFEAGEITAGEAIFASKAPKKEFSDPHLDEEEGKTFLFENCHGFGLDDTTTKGFWKLWALPNDDVLDDKGKSVYFVALAPSYDGKMTLGASGRKIKQIFAKILGHSAHPLDNAYVKNIDATRIDANSVYTKNLHDGSGASVYAQIQQAKSVYDNLSSAEVPYQLYEGNTQKTPKFTQGAGLYECGLQIGTGGGNAIHVNIGLVRINSAGTNHIATINNASIQASIDMIYDPDQSAENPYQIHADCTYTGWGSADNVYIYFRKII